MARFHKVICCTTLVHILCGCTEIIHTTVTRYALVLLLQTWGRRLISWSAERRSVWDEGLTENGAHQGEGIIDAAAFLHFGDDRVALGANILWDIIFG